MNTIAKEFIEKLANSNNPMLQQLGVEMNGLYPNEKVDDGRCENVEKDVVTGAATATKPKDEIDNVLVGQMPELDSKEPQNQSVFSTQKVATVRDLILERLKK